MRKDQQVARQRNLCVYENVSVAFSWFSALISHKMRSNLLLRQTFGQTHLSEGETKATAPQRLHRLLLAELPAGWSFVFPLTTSLLVTTLRSCVSVNAGWCIVSSEAATCFLLRSLQGDTYAALRRQRDHV